MLKHRFAKEFQLTASQEVGGTYQLIKKKNSQ